MKKHKFTILTLLLVSHFMNGQCVKNISTNPSLPLNNELDPNKINPFLNTFKWWENFVMNPNAGWAIPTTQTGIISPFDVANNPGSNFVAGTLGENNPRRQEWKPEDGWELVAVGNGNYPNGMPLNGNNQNLVAPFNQPSPLANDKVPYLILYNKYNGKLRVFANLQSQTVLQNQKAVMRLSYNSGSTNNVSGILRAVNNFDTPIRSTCNC